MSYPLAPPFAVPLTVLPAHECNYLAGRIATVRAFQIAQLSGAAYHQFMDAGFRRSGRIIYQPVCDGCRLCVPIRVDVQKFLPNKTQRRCMRRNADLVVTQSKPQLTDEKFDLYSRYASEWHGQPEEAVGGRESLESFLYTSPVETIESCYRNSAGKLVAVGIADLCTKSFSSVYFYFEPADCHRSLGTFGVLQELQWAKAASIPFYYLGFWVQGCRKMQYKSDFGPAEFLNEDGKWNDLRISVD